MTAAARIPTALAVLAASTVLAACSGTTGTLMVELTTAPGSQVLDAVTRLRLTLTNPREVVEAARTANGFELALEVDAAQDVGAVVVEGLDAGGAVIACGQTPGFSVGGINARVVVYMAPPRSIALSPRTLPAALSEVSAASLGFGVVIAGGLDSAGAPADELVVYNAFDHSLLDGLPLPEARAGIALAANIVGTVYLFGGTGPAGKAEGTLWRFDATAGPRGGYVTITDSDALARSREAMVSIGTDRYLITGAPPLTLDRGSLAQRDDIDMLPASGAPLTLLDASAGAVFAGDPLVVFHAGMFQALAASAQSDATAAALPDGRAVVIGGLNPVPQHDGLIVVGDTGNVLMVSNVLQTARARPAVAATSRYLLVAGGTDANGEPIASAELLDVKTLAPITTLPILARSGTFAIALSNDQVLIGGGSPPSAQLELFTPEPPI